jgi:hypothetical protein
MKRFIVAVAATSLALVLLAGAAGLVAAKSVFGPRIAEAGGLAPLAAGLPGDFKQIHDLPPEERFSHFLGAQMRFSDASNVAHTMTVAPGTVTTVSADRLTITLNDGGATRSYNLTAETRMHSAGRWSGGQAADVTPNTGDKVVVVTLDGSSDAKAVKVGAPQGFHHPGRFSQRAW